VTQNLSPSQTSGPLFGFSLLYDGSDGAAERDAVRVEGLVLDGDGAPLPHEALIELWEGEQFVRVRTDAEGRFVAYVVKPDCAPQAPHLNVTVFARGLLKQVQTRMYFPDEEEANARDDVLELVPAERRTTLVARPNGTGLRFDVHLQGPDETVFFAL
jgi:protocatechuate 3,4-dioxygenase, alpha subunit